ncbi:fer-1-like protein 4 [Gracilinanus agilis]|uniref:fer-1-like protein 4 n=1 Tax=Gracilinanus agilis TaxID=191870 RepID=UPI001CFCB158|nr:fer-1-like protein 4 [Gracilinanus agilis]
MALEVKVHRVTGLPGTRERQVQLSFRGFTQKTRRIHCGHEADIGEFFRWPHYGALLAQEFLSVQVVNCSRLFSPRILGTLVISLQHLQSVGHLVLKEALVDRNQCLSQIQVELDLKYQPPDGAAGAWTEEDFVSHIRNSSELTIRNVGFQELEPQESSALDRRAVALGQRLARGLGPPQEEEDDEWDLEEEPEDEISGVVFSPIKSRARDISRRDPHQVPKAQAFQVSVTVLEAQKLVGVNINPYVVVRVGEQRRETAKQRGTNCPFFNEHFLFEFHETRERLHELLLEITVFHSQTLPFLATRIGTFRMDLGIVCDQPDSRFSQKWAVLHDPQDTHAGAKGFVKVTLTVTARGELTRPLPPSPPGHSPDIEKNLLLPRGFPADRQWARLSVRLYRAKGLPAFSPGFLGGLVRVVRDQRVLVDPYIRVSFLGQQGETSVQSETTDPEWNEQLNFMELFPPLTSRIRLQLMDDAQMGDVPIATHVLDLRQISHPGRAVGFKPTFGPTWVPLYGSPPTGGLRDSLHGLNSGQGRGVWFRGRLLLAVALEMFGGGARPEPHQVPKGSRLTQMAKKKKKGQKTQGPAKEPEQPNVTQDGPELPSSVGVEVEELYPLPEQALAACEDFLLFAVLFEATMIDPSVGSQPISFEISIGSAGHREESLSHRSQDREVEAGARMDAQTKETQPLLELDPEPETRAGLDGLREPGEPMGIPGQQPEPMEGDGPYLCLPLRYEKPCVHVWSRWEDHTWRFQNSNCIKKVAERLDQGLQETERLLRRPGPGAWARLRQALEELVAGSRQYCRDVERRTMTRPNALDRSRRKMLTHSMAIASRQGLRLLGGLRPSNVDQKVMEAKRILTKLYFLFQEPQPPLPDVLVWMFSGQRRVALARIPAQDVLFSVVEEERGRDCGRIQSLLLTVPGAPPGEVCAKLELLLWLGHGRHAKACTQELPPELLPQPLGGLPHTLHRDDFSYFQLRAHLYQARGVLAADDSGLSDPFAHVLISTQCQSTRVLEQTLSPLWDELLVFEQLIIDGRREQLPAEPPLITINVFDYNKFGPPVFLGRALAAPQVKLIEESYRGPELQFFPLTKGPQVAGELIATFELIELDYSSRLEPSVPQDVEPQDLEFLRDSTSGRLSLPPGVRPLLKEFRIEVLFWGLRGLGRVHLFVVEQPQVVLEIGGQRVESEILSSYRENPNFTELVKHLTVDLPEQPYLQPPLSILVIERRAFGRTVLVGSHIVPHVLQFALQEPTELSEEERDRGPQGWKSPDSSLVRQPPEAGTSQELLTRPLKKLPRSSLLEKGHQFQEDVPELDELDWWSKYYASLQELGDQMTMDEDDNEDAEFSDMLNPFPGDMEIQDGVKVKAEGPVSQRKPIATLKIYSSPLEDEFGQFEDWLHVFPLYRGRGGRDGDGDEDRPGYPMGKFKGSFLIYPESKSLSEPRISLGLPQNRPIKLLVRVYVVKATSLAPADPNGKADPYVVVSVGRDRKDTKERYIPKQLNPIFGEVLELNVSLPAETELLVAVFDHDLVGSDDLIGETRIDLENRFYSHHRAHCGLASHYDTEGYNAWRDALKPSQVLASLCQRSGLPAPEYRPGEVKVGSKLFQVPPGAPSAGGRGQEVNPNTSEEEQALSVLLRWREMPQHGCSLVPEHVETRPLYHPSSPGLLQGFLHMWVDIFPNDVPAPPPVDIKPRQPISYELRVIIWNTEDVVLDDVNPLTGEMSSDIYVKSWVKGLEFDKQETDVHFNSLTGEGNFNWRFVFRFDYLPTEQEVSVKRKPSPFALEDAEFRQPAVLVLQVWDYDRISANDFLGSLELQLPNMVRGSRESNLCTIRLAQDRASPRCSLFRSRRMRGWWPFVKLREPEDLEREKQEAEGRGKKRKKRRKAKPEDIEFTDSSGNVYILTGKVEAEFELLTVEEAEKHPVGKGRKEPEALEKPNRPKTSFNWFVNPLKTFVFFIWRRYWHILVLLLVLALLTIFLLLVFYTIPGQISEVIFRPLH